MKEKSIGKVSVRKTGTDWSRLRKASDAEITRAVRSDPEARLTDAAFWKKAKLVLPKPKQTVTIRLDADLLNWLREQRGYQTRINAVLRAYMEAQKAS